ncbi:MAG: hypothetical protein ACE5MB_11510, partial [Anaerolineae bacterium]
MVRSTVIPKPDESLQQLIISTRQYRCACCGGPTLPVLEWHPPQDERPGYYLCSRCARFCHADEEAMRFEHAPRLRFDWERADQRWAVDLGFKKL